jgi:tRNA threonylcarbamoyladenosine biosynthesis protein TsaB
MNTLSNDTQQSINILAFDTSGDEASLALWTQREMRKLSIPFGTGSHSQAACLIPMMQEILTQKNISFQDLHVIATPTGPGSFTGIRLGLATAQGLLLSTKAKSFAPTTFQIAAFGAWRIREGSYLVTLSTKRESFYTQAFDKTLNPLVPGKIQTEEEIQDFLNHNPEMRRIHGSPSLGAEDLILFYLHTLNTSQDLHLKSLEDSFPEFLGKSSELLCPYYLHDPVFVKQKSWSL